MTNRVLLIYPSDATTGFLEPVIAIFYKHIHTHHFNAIKIDFNDDAHAAAIAEIKKDEYSTVFFLGHGTPSSLRGAKNEEYKNESFITLRDFSMFKGKNIVLLSCESSQLIKKVKQEFKSAIGFGDLPTDFTDIRAARENEANAYDGFTEDTINSFRKILVDIVRFSFIDYMLHNDMKFLKNRIQLRINKTIANNYMNRVAGYTKLNGCLLRMKQELLIIEPESSAS